MENKYRHELKFKISNSMANVLKYKLSLIMDKDKNGYFEDGSYKIKSLYFDDMFSTSYYEKLDGVLYRKKYRIRMYNDDDSFIRLEKKMKHDNMTLKNQMLISKETYSKIINGNTSDITDASGLLLEFLNEVKFNGLIPSVIVEYKRLTFVYPVSEVRITFDSDIKSGMYNYDILDNTCVMYDVNERGKTVLEVKFNEVLPLHISNILSDIPSYREACSKFALCRSVK